MTAVNEALVPLHRPATSSNINSSTGTSTARATHQQSGARPATAGSRVPRSHGGSRLVLATGGRRGRRRSRSAPSPPRLPRSLCTSVYGKAKATSRTASTGRAGSAALSGRLPLQQRQGMKKKEKLDEISSLKAVRAMLPWWRAPAPDGRLGNDGDDGVAAIATADNARLKQKQNATTPRNNAAATLVSGDATTATITTTTAAAAREKNTRLPATSGEFLQQRSRSSASSPLSITPTPQHTPHDDEDDQLNNIAAQKQQQRASTRGFNSIAASSIESAYDAYTDCSNLFENPPPSIPCVDQYVRRESIMYEAITKRARSRALPVKEPDSVLRVNKKGGNAPRDPLDDGSLDADVDPSALLFGDEDIDKVMIFFDSMDRSDGKITVEEMTLGFRKIRREWANLKADVDGRVVVGKLLRLLRRAGMSIETWFKFMDSSQGGRGDGKLTPLELRVGFQRLATHIARRECCCRAYKCERVPNYGLPPVSHTKKDESEESSDDAQPPPSPPHGPSPPPFVRLGLTDAPGKDAIFEKTGGGVAAAAAAGRDGGADKGGNGPNGGHTMRGPHGDNADNGGGKKLPLVNLDFAGKAVACREHALEGMVYLGQRRYFSDIDERTLTAEDINSLMKFVDTDVSYSLDISELSCSGTREAGELLRILEQHMRTTGARFTDVFFCIDRDGNGVIERHEFRTFFRRLAREPALERAKAKAKAELAGARAREQQLLELEAQEAFVRLEEYKKAGVYAVLKRIEVWQSRGGQRLGDIFQGVRTGDKGGECGMDADELAAFMRSLDLDLNPAEAMLVLRHLDVERNDLVELREVAAAVRNVRVDEAIIRDAKKHACSTLRPTSSARRRLAGVSSGGASAGGRREAGRGLGGREITERLWTDGHVVFRPSIASITHGRAVSAPTLRQRGSAINDAATSTSDAVLLPVVDNITTPSHRGTTRPATSAAAPGRPSTDLARESAGAAGVASAAAGERLGALTLRPGRTPGAAGRDCASGARPAMWRVSRSRSGSRSPERNSADRGVGREAVAPAAPGTGDAPPTSSELDAWQPWARGFGDGLGGEAGWWPEALSAVEDGSRLDIYTGTLLDGGWLDSLDVRLSATVRATRR